MSDELKYEVGTKVKIRELHELLTDREKDYEAIQKYVSLDNCIRSSRVVTIIQVHETYYSIATSNGRGFGICERDIQPDHSADASKRVEIKELIELISYYGLCKHREAINPGDTGYNDVSNEANDRLVKAIENVFRINYEMLDLLKECLRVVDGSVEQDFVAADTVEVNDYIGHLAGKVSDLIARAEEVTK
jgi:hypothetical protein